jgi:hypothetical protein
MTISVKPKGISSAAFNVQPNVQELPDIPMPRVAPKNTTGVTRIVVPGGIGDVYWCMVKMESFLRSKGITEKPQIVVLSETEMWESSRDRAIPFLKMIPFIQLGHPLSTPVNPVKPQPKCLRAIYDEISLRCGRSVIPDFQGFEYLMCFNGVINTGHWLEKDDPLECNWYFPLLISEEQKQFESLCRKKYGKYAVFYFSLYGDYIRLNVNQFSLEKMGEGIRRFTSECGLTPVFVGAHWDKKWPTPHRWVDYLPQLLEMIPGAVDLVGETSLDQVFGVLRGAELISGYHCGLTNMGIVFKKPSVLLWATDRFPPNTSLAVAPPDTRMKTYIPLYTKNLTVDTYVGMMKSLIGKGV